MPPPIPLPRIDPARAAEMPQPSDRAARPPSHAGGTGAAGVAASAFARLNQAVQDSVPQPGRPPIRALRSAAAARLEDLVKEMLRPMLKEWLDKNLPPMVERYVESEIVRLTRR